LSEYIEFTSTIELDDDTAAKLAGACRGDAAGASALGLAVAFRCRTERARGADWR